MENTTQNKTVATSVEAGNDDIKETLQWFGYDDTRDAYVCEIRPMYDGGRTSYCYLETNN